MKKLLVGLIVVGSALSASAGTKKSFSRPYGMAGCGLGSVLIGKEGSQLFAATSNNSSGNQTFGITAGTLNCVSGPKEEVATKSDFYIQSNRLTVQMDMAKGQGETLTGLSKVLGCANADQFGKTMKANYRTIFNKENGVTNKITDAIITVIQNDNQLAQQCHLG